eukprot:1076797_1
MVGRLFDHLNAMRLAVEMRLVLARRIQLLRANVAVQLGQIDHRFLLCRRRKWATSATPDISTATTSAATSATPTSATPARCATSRTTTAAASTPSTSATPTTSATTSAALIKATSAGSEKAVHIVRGRLLAIVLVVTSATATASVAEAVGGVIVAAAAVAGPRLRSRRWQVGVMATTGCSSSCGITLTTFEGRFLSYLCLGGRQSTFIGRTLDFRALRRRNTSATATTLSGRPASAASAATRLRPVATATGGGSTSLTRSCGRPGGSGSVRWWGCGFSAAIAVVLSPRI